MTKERKVSKKGGRGGVEEEKVCKKRNKSSVTVLEGKKEQQTENPDRKREKRG